MRESKRKAVLFDMDGVIFDTERLFTDCFLQVSNADARRSREEMERMLGEMRGRNARDCHRIALRYLHDIDTYRRLTEKTDDLFRDVISTKGMPVKAGMAELFAWLESRPILTALVTSTNRDRVEEYFSHTDLPWIFDASVCGLEIGRGKPAPGCYLTAAAKLGVRADQCLVLEDSLPGIRAGVAAGAAVVMIPDLTPPDTYAYRNCQAIVQSGTDVIRMLEGEN